MTKAAFERHIAEQLGAQLGARSYLSEYDGEVYAFYKYHGEARWRITFYLTGDVLFSAFVKFAVFYPRMEQIIRSLPVKEPFEGATDRLGIATSTVLGYSEPQQPQHFSECVELASYCSALLAAIARAEAEFAEPYSSLDRALADSTRFYTKWPEAMGPMMTGLLLIAGGLDRQQRDLVRMGTERIRNKIGCAQTAWMRDLMLAVAAAAEAVAASQAG